jgi:arsenate reductase (thioredoxin)
MAEGYLKSLNKFIDIQSAGTNPAEKVNPYAIKVMNEIGVDISKHKTKNVNEFLNKSFDFVITVCDSAKDVCPVFTGDVKQRLHIGFEYPAGASGTEDDILKVYQKVRDEIMDKFTEFNRSL